MAARGRGARGEPSPPPLHSPYTLPPAFPVGGGMGADLLITKTQHIAKKQKKLRLRLWLRLLPQIIASGLPFALTLRTTLSEMLLNNNELKGT